MKKIGIFGAHCTGKTELAGRIQDVLSGLGKSTIAISEVARDCRFGVNQDMTEDGQRWMFHEQILRELNLKDRYEFMICDRTALDPIVYAHAGGLWEMAQYYLLAATDWMKTYDHLYFCRPDGRPLVDDGFRDLDPAWHARIDHVFEKYLFRYSLSKRAMTVRGAVSDAVILNDILDRNFFGDAPCKSES